MAGARDVPEAVAWSALIVLALVIAQNARQGTLSRWVAAKFLNRGDVPPLGGPLTLAQSLGLDVAKKTPFDGAQLADPVPSARTGDGWGAPRSGGRRHKGVDLIAPAGVPIHAAAGGRATLTNLSLCGTGIEIRHSTGKEVYCHLSARNVRGGATVTRGQIIGLVGATGNAAASVPHLHFEVHRGGKAVPAEPYIGRG